MGPCRPMVSQYLKKEHRGIIKTIILNDTADPLRYLAKHKGNSRRLISSIKELKVRSNFMYRPPRA